MRPVAVAVCAALLGACTSPEAERVQGGGPGADIGNRGDEVLMHEGSKPFEDTPQLSGVEAPPLEGANHAHRLSTE